MSLKRDIFDQISVLRISFKLDRERHCGYYKVSFSNKSTDVGWL